MRHLFKVATCTALLFTTVTATRTSAQDIKRDHSWDEIRSENRSVVFGRFVGQFNGSDFKDIRLKVLDIENDRTQTLDVVEGLGIIEELLPPVAMRCSESRRSISLPREPPSISPSTGRSSSAIW